MELPAGRPGPDPKATPRPGPLARSPLVPRPAGKGIRSSPVVLPAAAGGGGGKSKLLPMEAPEPKRRFSRLGLYLAIGIAVITIPFTLKSQRDRARQRVQGSEAFKTNYEVPMEKRQWRMHGLVDDTEKQVVDRFGPPYLSRNFNMSDGAFVGPLVGQKHFYAKTIPDYEARATAKEDEVAWTYPQYLVIREIVWKFPDSYLTVWLREPRAEIDLSDDNGVTRLPRAPEGGGDWVVIDNFRIGKDLFKTPPAAPAASPSPAAPTP